MLLYIIGKLFGPAFLNSVFEYFCKHCERFLTVRMCEQCKEMTVLYYYTLSKTISEQKEEKLSWHCAKKSLKSFI